ncbi:hypothetical protein COU16_00030 [Candidatus Kaiserbacteria bacterium CG10_big_fil_rev_8_21_14_0_10_47_16]|uniref:Uncharacterized protein n=1 Tax=Candidatus Kaiserbacteria bacterium CG10_big_fil_rev_8_21_14_0_10_47_16 TaxID=1974608 RepID=A0A2H0UGG5_9BACT|nr:MAG: hypothetical protein COU16_00030 [Candidatus Kaiserbacteria bacterium CG10_big_fil_rev_8_21_14_0_10_47_16]
MIGIFDSGMGGLTVMRAIRDVLPDSDIIYFGDIKHAPYGSRSRSELSVLTAQAVKRLQMNGATKIVSACNSLSASLAVSVFDVFSLEPGHIIEMVGPTVSYLKDVDAHVMLVATPATIDSELYQQAFQMLGKDVQYTGISDLAGAIEFGASRQKIKEIIEYSFEGKERNFDLLVLACTHYPLVTDIFQEVFGKEIRIFDPAFAVAERAKKLFWPQEVGNGTTKFLISEDSEFFRERVAEMFPESPFTIEVV